MLTLFNYLLIFNIFAGGFLIPLLLPFEFYLGYVFILIFLFAYVLKYREIKINKTFFIVIGILGIPSLINVYLGNNTLLFFTKQVVGILITGSAYYLLIKVNKFNIDKLFIIYLRIALIVAAIGIFQEVSFLIGFKCGYDYSFIIPKWRVIPVAGGMLRLNSIFTEPSHFAISMAPALFVALVNILRRGYSFALSKIESLIIIISYVLTFSAVAYLLVIISLCLLSYTNKKKSLLAILIIGVILFYGGYHYSPEIRMRVNDTVGVARGSLRVTRSHLTVYAYISNAYVAFKSFTDDPLFGHGLGSHPISYDKYIRPGLSNNLWQKGYTGVNKNDANSLLLRLVSETGLLGIFLVLYFLIKFYLKFTGKESISVMNNAVLVLFIIQLLRQGHYFYNGFLFFVWLYYFSYKIYNKQN